MVCWTVRPASDSSGRLAVAELRTPVVKRFAHENLMRRVCRDLPRLMSTRLLQAGVAGVVGAYAAVALPYPAVRPSRMKPATVRPHVPLQAHRVERLTRPSATGDGVESASPSNVQGRRRPTLLRNRTALYDSADLPLNHPSRDQYESALMESGLLTLVITATFSGAVLLLLRIRKQHFAEKQLQILAAVDASTGAATKEVLDAAMMTAWRRAKREGNFLSLLVANIDRFSGFGETYGRIASDEVLWRITGAIRQATGQAAHLTARVGQDEFAVLLPDMSPSDTLALAEGIRRAIMALAIPYRNSEFGAVTVSLGAASFVPVANFPRSPLGLFRLAQINLQAAKRSGRNAVVGPS